MTKDFFGAYPLRTFEKGETMLQAEETLPGVFYIVEGRVSQYDITPNGNEVVVNVFKPGAFFPASSAMNNTPNHYFFEASTKTVTRVAPAAEVVQFLKDNPDILFDLLSRVYRGVDGVLRRMAHLMGGDSKSRLLFELLNAATRFGEQRSDGSVFINLKEGDIARHSGLARETVNRTIQDFKASGLVGVTRAGITVRSIEELEAVLGVEL
jgi:CRP-like cAMP-binding protein